ncbi:tRNA preQ1(34) S-adenosylmethionine ribosyltransferase-isomerase QueA [Magnetofaba australis]|uniref:S-adenosylmethionine:tRNA ribosyltransferase-isomerase n=1 Tax=Magnetofaba australis IT-1 TaxID=1434232 RepID=A0A1Y2K2T6_9PROT|nr:tRNA preQ1(34) S-adenosylmethionine ribosyltransferase-isomerase QueA [Magnetofaba australis]OSM02340.1 putative S-adenosylmethionine--tRNA ribosyltransferase-isomerase [Magnetofaba australis IT-1]
MTDRLEDYDYPLPPERIAQAPAEPRDASRLLVSLPDSIEDRRFGDIKAYLRAGDLLVVNDTRVIPARLMGRKASGGKVELFLVKPLDNAGTWEALTKTSKPLKPGTEIHFSPTFRAIFEARQEDGSARARLVCDDASIDAAVEQHGQMPLPPYIQSDDPQRDKQRYQTVYADQPGAVAAPTAGLHFTPELLSELCDMGVKRAHVTLHVGLGTFQPVRESDLDKHVMHAEWFSVTPETADLINQTRAAGGRIVAVGTTSARTLESAADEAGVVHPGSGETRLFIRPGYRFRAVDLLITNFHLPKSTLLMLVSALIGKQRLDRDYVHAMTEQYRFYSYGDAMLAVP